MYYQVLTTNFERNVWLLLGEFIGLGRCCLHFQALEIYVFDDADPEPAFYLGVAKVPLITLANDKTIKGTFELRKVSQKISSYRRIFVYDIYDICLIKKSIQFLMDLQTLVLNIERVQKD